MMTREEVQSRNLRALWSAYAHESDQLDGFGVAPWNTWAGSIWERDDYAVEFHARDSLGNTHAHETLEFEALEFVGLLELGVMSGRLPASTHFYEEWLSQFHEKWRQFLLEGFVSDRNHLASRFLLRMRGMGVPGEPFVESQLAGAAFERAYEIAGYVRRSSPFLALNLANGVPSTVVAGYRRDVFVEGVEFISGRPVWFDIPVVLETLQHSINAAKDGFEPASVASSESERLPLGLCLDVVEGFIELRHILDALLYQSPVVLTSLSTEAIRNTVYSFLNTLNSLREQSGGALGFEIGFERFTESE